MSSLYTQVIYAVTGAGLLLAAFTCSADSTANVGNKIQSADSAPISDNVNEVIPVAPPSPSLNSLSASSPVAVNPSAVQTNENQQYAKSYPPAQTSSPPPNSTVNTPKIGSGAHLLNVTVGLLLIIGLIFGLSWFVKRFSQGSFSANSHLKIITTLPLGTRERIVLIDAGGKQLLLGITPTNITTLHVFDTPVIANEADANSSDFARKLMAILQRPNTINDDSNKNNNSGIR